MSSGMGNSVLQVSNLTKVYRKGSEGASLVALDGLSFELRQGEILGVIGSNGAGKSTLLKVLSEITAPTTGEVRYKGRLTSILDFGTGFHPDLSGRENIFLNGSILGFSTQEIKEAYADILAFSGLEDYIEMPVKQYSSGMYLRLAFSVAFHFDMDILLLDEILAVGDSEFRAKCLKVMRDLIHSGKTIVIVSHNMDLLAGLCTRCLWLEKGSARMLGEAPRVIDRYLETVSANQAFDLSGLDHDLFRLELPSVNGGETIRTGEAVNIAFMLHKKSGPGTLQVLLSVYNIHNDRLLCDSEHLRQQDVQSMPQGRYRYVVQIPDGWLGTGTYTIHITVTLNTTDVLFENIPFGTFKVEPNPDEPKNRLNSMSGSLHPQLTWKTTFMDA